MMKQYVYILECADQSLYVGCTSNLEKRVLQHNHTKLGAHYTKIRRPVKLVYHEEYESLALGRKREAEIKRWPRGRKVELIKRLSV